MNPWELTSSGLLIWGLVAHLIADWPLQNDWMANNKSKFGWSMIVHSGIHGVLLAIIFGWVAVPLAVAHGIIDTRKPVIWWSKLIRQTQPIKTVWFFRYGYGGHAIALQDAPKSGALSDHKDGESGSRESQAVAVDVGLIVRFWTDQVFHIACVAIAALIVVSV